MANGAGKGHASVRLEDLAKGPAPVVTKLAADVVAGKPAGQAVSVLLDRFER